MRRLCAFVFLIAFATASRANCIGSGHFTVATAQQPLTGIRYPYTEDLASSGAPVVIAYRQDLGWTKVQSGCASTGERNLLASGPSNVLLRASVHFVYAAQDAPAGTRYEVQFRIATSPDAEPLVAVTEQRRLAAVTPVSERFATVVRDLPAGNYVYSLWMRVLDAPASNRIAVDLRWITAQGVPNVYPAASSTTSGEIVAEQSWTPVGEPLAIDASSDVDAILQSSFTIDGGDAATIGIAFGVDGAPPGDRFGNVAMPRVLPDRTVAFDHAAALGRGTHRLQLFLRGAGGRAVVSDVRSECITFPRANMRPQIIPLQDVTIADPMLVTTDGSDVQPAAMSAICGRWTKIAELTLAPSRGSFSWTLEGFVEIVRAEGTYAQIGIDAVHREVDHDDPSHERDYVTDMGMFEVQLAPDGGGVYIFGDCSKWGNYDRGATISLWMRRIEGCNDAPFGGGFVVGRRWLTAKLLPSEGRHVE